MRQGGKRQVQGGGGEAEVEMQRKCRDEETVREMLHCYIIVVPRNKNVFLSVCSHLCH